MTELKHTPGPWYKADYCKTADEITILAADGAYVCSVDCDGCYDENKWFSQLDADARLIAAAPDLLEALEWYRDQMCEGFCVDLKAKHFYDESMDFHCAGCKARAAVAKAKGGAE